MATKKAAAGPKVKVDGMTPFLWFQDQAEPAARFYVATFRGSKFHAVMPSGDGGVMAVEFEVAGQRLIAMNGGDAYRLTPAFSLQVACPTQKEVDVLWKRLVKGGEESQCGWLVDRFGLSWQILPNRLNELLGDPDPARAGRAAAAMMKMRKIDVAALERAVEGA